MIFKALHKGIDSLYISYRGSLRGNISRTLEIKKSQAQSVDIKNRVEAVMELNNHYFEVLDKGCGKFKYVLVDGHYHISVSNTQQGNLPVIYVQVSSELLNTAGTDYAVTELRKIVDQFLENIHSETVSRADIFIDFITDTDFGKFESRDWVTRAVSNNKWSSGSKCTGWGIGSGGNIYCRLYSKIDEILKTGKAHFKKIWKSAGWHEGQAVWRVEFQLRREVLKELSVHTVSDLMSSLNDIWRYCTCKWLRLAVGDGIKNRARWKIHPLWNAIQQVKFGDGTYLGLTRDSTLYRSRVPSDKILFQNGFGYLTSYATVAGHYEVTRETVFEYYADMQRFYENNSGMLGCSDFSEFTRIKIKEKRRKFNIRKGDDYEG